MSTFLHVPAHMITVGDFQSDWRKCNPTKSSKVNGDGRNLWYPGQYTHEVISTKSERKPKKYDLIDRSNHTKIDLCRIFKHGNSSTHVYHFANNSVMT